MFSDKLKLTVPMLAEKLTAAILVASLAVSPLCAQPVGAPTLGPASAADLSPMLERKLGEAIMEQGRRDPDYISDPDIDQYLNNMARKLAAFAPGGAPDIEAFGVRENVINAFAMPGGFIGINTGLIVAADDESELAGVMGHEIAHVVQRHIARGLTQQQKSGYLALASMAAALLAALVPGGGANLAAGIAAFGQAAAIEQQLGFSRDAEQEADRMGFEMLRKAGYDPNGMAIMFGRLMKSASLNEGRGGGVYASTHPLSIQRMTDMQNRISQLPLSRYQASDAFWFIRAKSRVIQATDPKSLRLAIEQLQEETRQTVTERSSLNPVRRAAAWYGISYAALVRKDLADASSALQQAQTIIANSPYLELQRIDIELANKNNAGALTIAQAAMKRWPDRRSFAQRVAQCLQLLGKDKEAVAFLSQQIKRWPSAEPGFFQMRATSEDRLGDQVAARQSMASYYILVGALPAAATQLQQARTMSQDFYVQSQIDVELRQLTKKIMQNRRLLEKLK
jgi:predicted Zn-dependent protease